MSSRRQASDDTEQGFLKRWSRRKARTEDTSPPDPPSEHASEALRAPGDGALMEDQQLADGEPVPSDADMPDLDSIDEATDMSGFFSPGVSESLRAQALRRLFRLPKFNITDGLDDYNEDYRSFETLAAGAVTPDTSRRLDLEAEGGGSADETEPPPLAEPDALETAEEHDEDQAGVRSAEASHAGGPAGPEDGNDLDAGESTHSKGQT